MMTLIINTPPIEIAPSAMPVSTDLPTAFVTMIPPMEIPTRVEISKMREEEAIGH